MTPLPTIHLFHDSDAPQHLTKLQEILQRLKAENRIVGFAPIRIDGDFPSLNTIKGNDMALSLLTLGLEAQLKKIEIKLNSVKEKNPNVKIVEIIIDHVPYGNERIIFPDDLRPIRDREDMDAVWRNIERKLKDLFPATKVPQDFVWTKYLKVAGVFIGLLIAFFFLRLLKGGNPEQEKAGYEKEATTELGFDRNGLDTDDGEKDVEVIENNVDINDEEEKITPTPNKRVQAVPKRPELVADFSSDQTECEFPCKFLFTNRSQPDPLDAITFSWDFGDGNSSSQRGSISYEYENPGTYEVKLTASGYGQINTKKQVFTVTEPVNDEIYDVVENMPTPQGGMEGWNQYLRRELKYPTQARRMGIEGNVYVVFVVNTDGTIQDVDLLRGIGGGCDEEAIRVVKASPKWEPGKQGGRPVRVKMRLPIRFKLS